MEEHPPEILPLARQKKGVGTFLEVCIDEPDMEWLMVDASHVKAYQHAAGAVGGNQGIGLAKGSETAKYIGPVIRMAYRSEPLSWRVQSLIVRRL